MDVASEQLERSRIWAYWGFAGVVNPVVGIIASSISLSILNRLLIEDDDDSQSEHVRLTNLANVTRIISALMLLVFIIGGVYAGNAIIDSINKNKAAEASYRDAVDRYEELYP